MLNLDPLIIATSIKLHLFSVFRKCYRVFHHGGRVGVGQVQFKIPPATFRSNLKKVLCNISACYALTEQSCLVPNLFLPRFQLMIFIFCSTMQSLLAMKKETGNTVTHIYKPDLVFIIGL